MSVIVSDGGGGVYCINVACVCKRVYGDGHR